jgi:predicted ATPase
MRWLAPYSVFQQSLPDVFSEAVTQGRRQTAKEIIRAIIPGLENIEVLTDAGNPVVHLVYNDHSVPVESSGDGVMALVRLALELAARPDGTVLIEEPEVHEHPGAIRQSAKAILEATRRNIQVLLSTHSLDFIDALVAAATPEDLSKMCAYRFALEAGELRTTAIPGTEVARLRGEIGEDLR